MPLHFAQGQADVPYQSGLLIPLAPNNGAGAVVAAANTLYLRRVLVRVPVVPVSFGIRTTVGGAGSSFKVGVWREAAASRVPTGLPIMSNNVGEGTTSNSTNDMATVSGVAMRPGVPYWIGFVFTGTLPTVAMCLSTDLDFAIGAGVGLGNSGGAQQQGYSVAQTYTDDIGALDLTSASLTNVVGAAIPLPVLGT